MEFIVLGAILAVIISVLFTIKVSYIKSNNTNNTEQHESISQQLTGIVSAENRSKPVGEFMSFIKQKKPLAYNMHKNSKLDN